MDLNTIKRRLENKTSKTAVRTASVIAMSLSVILNASLSIPALAAKGNTDNPIVRQVQVTPPGAAKWAPDQLIVMPKKGLDKEDMAKSISDIDGKIIQKDLMGVAYLVEVPKDKLDEELNKAKKDKNFVGVQKNMTFHANLAAPSFGVTPNDPGFSQQFYLSQLGIPSAWALGATGAGIVFGTLDTGVDYNLNIDLQNRTTGLLAGKGYQSYKNLINGAEEDLSFGHGTFVTNCYGASTNNNFGFASPCFNAGIVPVSIVGTKPFSGGDPLSSNDFAIGNGIEFLMLNNVKLANLSFNVDPPGTISDFAFHPLLQFLIQIYAAGGGILFNSAGNSGTPHAIANQVPGLVPVASIDPTGQPSTFTVWGPAIQFAAPGEMIAQTAYNGIAYIASGTSFSSPLSAGVAGQIASVNPGLPMPKVLQIMAATTTHPPNSLGQFQLFYGYGVPNAAAGVRLAQTSF